MVVFNVSLAERMGEKSKQESIYENRHAFALTRTDV